MFKRIKADRRTKVRKAEKAGTVFEVGDGTDAMRHYYDVRCQTTRRGGHPDLPWEHFSDSWDAMHANGMLKVFLARIGGRVGAGQMAFMHNGYVHLTGVSFADWTITERVPANDFLQWHVLRWAIENGNRIVDFVGAQPGSHDKKVQAIDHFKSRWGTEVYESLVLEKQGSRLRVLMASVVRRFLG